MEARNTVVPEPAGKNPMLFAYGTLQDSDVLAAVLSRPVTAAALTDAQLAGFTIVHYLDHTYPALVHAPNVSVRGKLIGGLDSRDLALIDAFEGKEYRRTLLAVIAGGTPQRAFAYLPTLPISNSQAPWTPGEWTSRHKTAFMGEECGIH